MQQLTVRGFDRELLHALRVLAQERNLSLNKTALLLMRRGAGLHENPERNVVGSSVDHLIGTWSAKDEADFKAATQGFSEIDSELWK